jgi:hypothetical protein
MGGYDVEACSDREGVKNACRPLTTTPLKR